MLCQLHSYDANNYEGIAAMVFFPSDTEAILTQWPDVGCQLLSVLSKGDACEQASTSIHLHHTRSPPVGLRAMHTDFQHNFIKLRTDTQAIHLLYRST